MIRRTFGMSDPTDGYPAWEAARRFLLDNEPSFCQDEPSDPLTLQLEDEDWTLEITPQGTLICQAGYALDDMKSMLSDGTAEDLGSDELAKQAKFYLQQTIAKHRNRLKQERFSERIEMNDEYVAAFFEKPVDLLNLPDLAATIHRYRLQFSSS